MLKKNDEIGLIKTDFLIIGSVALGLILKKCHRHFWSAKKINVINDHWRVSTGNNNHASQGKDKWPGRKPNFYTGVSNGNLRADWVYESM